MKELTSEKYCEAEDLLIKAENILEFTEMDSEANLLNHIRSYLRLKADLLRLNNKVVKK